MTEAKKKDLPAVAHLVRLVASARFYTETILPPPGIGARDLHGFLEGEVEELSLFPLESTAWGYLGDARQPGAAPVLIYAAFRDQIGGAGEPDPANCYAVLPGFAVLHGRKLRKTSWIVLCEPECATLVRIPARSVSPDYVRSLFYDASGGQADAWTLREKLLGTAPVAEGDRVEEGLVRCIKPVADRRGDVLFPLERQRQPGAPWKRYATGRLGPQGALFAADVRDRRFLDEERGRRRAVRQLRGLLRFVALCLLLLAVLQYLHIRRSRHAAAMAAQIEAQRPAVMALQEQEALARSAARVSDAPLEVFDWLMAVNDVRPETVSFTSAYADRAGGLGFSGEAPSVAAVNQFREALEKSGRCSQLDVKELNSTKQGVKFTMQVRILREDAAAGLKAEDVQ